MIGGILTALDEQNGTVLPGTHAGTLITPSPAAFLGALRAASFPGTGILPPSLLHAS